MVEEVGDDSQEDGEEERECPEEDGMWRVEEQAESGECVFEAFFLESAGDFEAGLDKEDTDTADAAGWSAGNDCQEPVGLPNEDMPWEVSDQTAKLEGSKSEEDQTCLSA